VFARANNPNRSFAIRAPHNGRGNSFPRANEREDSDERHLRKAIALARRALGGFAAFHAANMVLNLAYTLLQLIAITRAVGPDRYAGIVLLVSVGFYFQPLDQAIGRANYIRLNRQANLPVAPRTMDEIALLDALHSAAMIAVCFIFPIFSPGRGLDVYLEDSFLMLSILLMNSWGFNLQPIAWALGLEFAFSILSLARRIFHLFGLLLLWLTGSMLVFCLIVGASSIAFHLFARIWIATRSPLVPLLPRWRALTKDDITSYLRQIANSSLSSLSELLVLNSPYVIIGWLYGASALMVIFDSIMKVARPPMMAARVFVETQIPRVTRAMIAGQTEAVEKSIWYTTVVCAIGSLVVAAIVLMKGQLIFQILLGPNNIVEPDFFPVAAGIILAATSYQPISAFLSYGDFQSAVRKFALTSIVGFSVCSLSIHYSGGGARDILWFYVIYCSACLLIGAVLLHLQLGDRRIQSLEKIP